MRRKLIREWWRSASRRRSRNPRWLVWGIAICFVASAGVGLAPVPATAASSTISTVEAPRLGSTPSAARGEPRPNIKFRGPQFVVQPRLVGRNLVFAVSVNPHRTADNNSSAKADILRGQIDVSRSGVAISTVGLDRKDRTKQLIFTTKFKERVVRRAGRIEYQIRLPLAVARSLAATPISERTTRVRVVLVHAKDTNPSLPWRETLSLAQSNIRPERSRVATERRKAPNIMVGTTWVNQTPFILQVSVQPTQCLDMPQWTGTIAPGGNFEGSATVLESGNPNGLSTWQNLGQSAVTSLKGAAEDAGQDAIKGGAESFTPEGAIDVVVDFTTSFLIRFITTNLEQPTCENTPTTWVISTVATGLPLTTDNGLPLPLWQGSDAGAVAEWAGNSGGNPFQSGPEQTVAQLMSTLGAQTSVQWNWNDGNVVADGPGSSYFSGGLIQTATSSKSGWIDTNFYYQNNAQNSYGPIQTSNVTLSGWAGTNPNGNTPAVSLTCNTGIWSFTSPWGSYSYDLSSPPNSSSSSQLVMSFYYNGVDGSGNSVTGQPIPGIGTITSNYADSYQQEVWVDQSTIQSIIQSNGYGMITSWGCSVQAQSQVPSFQEPPGWPSGGNTSNLSWYSVPVNVTLYVNLE